MPLDTDLANCNKRVWAYPPVLLDPTMELQNTALVTGGAPPWDAGKVPYNCGDEVQIGDCIYGSTSDGNSVLPFGAYTTFFPLGALPYTAVDRYSENDAVGTPTGMRSQAKSSAGYAYGTLPKSATGMTATFGSQTTMQDVNAVAISVVSVEDVVKTVSAPPSEAPNMQVILNGAGITTTRIYGNRGTNVATGGLAVLPLTVTLLPNEYLSHVEVKIVDDPATPANDRWEVFYEVGLLRDDLPDTSLLRIGVQGGRDWYNLKAGGSAAYPLPSPVYDFFSGRDNESWEWQGWTRSFGNNFPYTFWAHPGIDFSLAGYQGQLRLDNVSGLSYRMVKHLGYLDGRLPTDPPPLNLCSKAAWKKIRCLNPYNVYEPSTDVRTTADLTLTIEWLIPAQYESLTLVGLLGDEVNVTLLDDMDVEIFNEDFDLDSPAVDYIDWLFGDGSAKDCRLFLPELPYSTDNKLKITITRSATVGIGGVYPSTAQSLGLQDYAPSLGVVATTRNDLAAQILGLDSIALGSLTHTATYKTKTPASELTSTMKTLRAISRIAKEHGYPTLFRCEYLEDDPEAFTFLGYMPTYIKTLINKKQTSSTIKVTGAGQCL